MAIGYPDNPPPEPGFKRAQLQIQNVSPSSQNPASMQRKDSHLGHARWTGTLVVDDMDQSQAKEWKAWIVKMTGHVGTFRLGDPGYFGPYGEAENQGSVWKTSLSTKREFPWIIAEGYKPETRVFRRGDQVEIDGDLKIIMQDIVTNDNGRAIMHVVPRIRDLNIEGEPIIHDNPTGLFRLNQSVSQWDDETIMSQMEFPIQEVLNSG